MEPNTNEQIKEKSFGALFKKMFLWIIVIFIAVGVLLVWGGNNFTAIERKVYAWQGERHDKAMKEYENKLIAQYAADKDGGKSPEETIDLLIAALKVGDTVKASKYYVLEKQEEELKRFDAEALEEYGSLQKSVDFYSEVRKKGTKKCNGKGDGCVFEYIYTVTEEKKMPIYGRNEVIVIPAGEESVKEINVKRNPFSGVWKIEF